MRIAYTLVILLLVLSIAPFINASNNQTYTSSDMNCWNGFGGTNIMTNPQAFEQITIPKYVKSITLSVSKGLGNGNVFKLRNCAYNSCNEGVQNYMVNCPTIDTYGFGALDLTNILAPSTVYDLRLDALGIGQNGQSVQVLTSVLTIEKQFLYNESNAFDYQSDRTVRRTTVEVYSGEGNCSAQFAPNADFNLSTARVSNESIIANAVFNESNSSVI